MPASDMYSNHVPGPSGFPVPVGPGPVTTWNVDTHPVHREVTSLYPPLGIFGPGSSQPGNPLVDVHGRCGLPPSMYYYGVPLLRQLDFRFRCRCTRLLVRLLLRRIRLRRRLSCTVVVSSIIRHRCR